MTADAHFGHDADSVLGGYREWQVNGALAELCEAVWIYSAGAAPVPHRLLPDGKPSLAIRLQRTERGDLRGCDAIISGGRTRAGWYRPEPFETLIAARLYPEAAQAIGLSPAEHANSVTELPAALARRIEPVLDAAANVSPAEIFHQLAAALRPPLHALDTRPEQAASALLRQTRGCLPVAALSARVGLSERQLRRRFLAATGMSPKQYARLLRHLAAMLMADSQGRPRWADIAAAAGYADQSHLIRDARSLSGSSPAQLHAERRRESEMFNTGGIAVAS